MKDNYKKYWKVTLKISNYTFGVEEDRVFNRVESLDKFFKKIDRNIDFEIERLSVEEYNETEKYNRI